MITRIDLTQGQFALVDDELAHVVESYKWYAAWSPSSHKYYAARNDYSGDARKVWYMHRVLWEYVNGPIPEGLEVDHISCDSLDNRMSNLQVGSHREKEITTQVQRIPFDKAAYDESCTRYEQTTDHKLRNSDTIVVGGYGFSMKVDRKALVLRSERVTQEEKIVKLYCGTHNIKQIVILSDGGYFTISAIQWCIGQDITVILLDWRGDLIQVLTPRHPSNAELIWQQYQASRSNLAFSISVELVRRKAQAQLSTLAHYSYLPKQAIAVDTIGIQLANLHRASTVTRVRACEGVMSSAYFSVFYDLPIRWQKSLVKTLPPHWLTITNRTSPLANGHGAWRAVNPFHAALNFALALLKGQVLQSVYTVGLDPTCGYLHPLRRVHNQVSTYMYSLVCDLQEPLRGIVDAKVLAFFEKTIFRKGDFYQIFSGECRMNEELRRYILATCRVDQEAIDDTINWLKATLERG